MTYGPETWMGYTGTLQFGNSVSWYTFNRMEVTPTLSSAAYGKPIPYSFGHRKIVGQVIWGKPINVGVQGWRLGWDNGPNGLQNYGAVWYTYTATFAVSFGYTGPGTTELIRLWANSTLIYDSTTQSLPSWITFYSGTETQTQDPTILADKGSVTPAYRGHVYVVIRNLDLAQYAGAVPVITAEIGTVVMATYATFDFTTDSYVLDGTAYTFNDLWQTDGVYSLPTTDASGLHHSGSPSNERAKSTTLLNAAILDGSEKTFVLEYTLSSATGGDYTGLELYGNPTASNDIDLIVTQDTASTWDAIEDATSNSLTGSLTNGTNHKIALRITDTNMSVCVDGGVVTTTTLGSPSIYGGFCNLFFTFTDSPTVRSMNIYGSTSDAQMQSLTA